MHQLYKMLLGDNVHWQDREAWIYSQNVYTRYPFQGSLYRLPSNVIKECIVGAIEARFGALEESSFVKANGANGHTNGKAKRGIAKTAPANRAEIRDCLAPMASWKSATLAKPAGAESNLPEPRNFEEFIYKVWGAGIAKHFAIPYNRKLWAVPLSEMETSWLGGRVPLPDLEEMIEGAFSPRPDPWDRTHASATRFAADFRRLMDAWAAPSPRRTAMDSRWLRSPRRATPEAYDRRGISLPAPDQHHAPSGPIRAIGEEAPADIRAAAAACATSPCAVCTWALAAKTSPRSIGSTIPRTLSFTAFSSRATPPTLQPAGRIRPDLRNHLFGAQAAPLRWRRPDAKVHRGLSQGRILRPDDPVGPAPSATCRTPTWSTITAAPRAWPIREWLAERDILLAGRYSEWDYYNSDHAFIAGKKATDQVRQLEAAEKASEFEGVEGMPGMPRGCITSSNP